ncbi:Uu.00g003110.m01.CDS01 [Anthostomella pinea]|uniref:Uu.00g003110.m01.CDS01 n=1 Tax=Anthostomella pinea TaxID=933095 RepID=A0AAI8YIK3_9PEZI|nr:Uu.00g003110.m01.CDS01 [Anthostomella pinea]
MCTIESLQSLRASHFFYGLFGLVVGVGLGFVRQYLLRTRLDFPVFGSPRDPNPRDAVLEGQAKCGDSPYFVTSSQQHRTLVLPMSLYTEVNSHPEKVVSFRKIVKDTMYGRYTDIGGTERPELLDAIRQDLMRNLGRVIEDVQDETHHALAAELPDSAEQWTQTNAFAKVLQVVARLSGRVFVGLPLAREPEWIAASIRYTVNAAGIRHQANEWNALVRPFVVPFLPAVRAIRTQRRRARELMRPLLEELLLSDAADNREKSAGASRGSFLSWIVARMPWDIKTAQRLGDDQLLLTFAAIHTTSITATAAIMDLATYPQHIEPLRQEIEQVLAEEGIEENADGHVVFPKPAMARLKKLDSFIKESQRWSPMGYTISSRMIMQDVTLSTGLTLPKGAMITFPQYAVHTSPDTPTLSPAYNAPTPNPGPDVFAGFRFANLRSVPGRETRHQVVTTSLDSLTFGHGPHACPGRFFAVAEVKALLIDLLRNYDIRLVGDVEGEGGEGRRPGDGRHGLSRRVGMHCVLEVRRRARG